MAVHYGYAPTLVTPECGAPRCSEAGDQYTMIHCRSCHAWFCREHIASEEGARLLTTISPALHGLTYYQGICTACRKASGRKVH